MAATEIRFARDEPASRTRHLPFAVTTERVLFVLFVGGLAWVPFWFGSNRLIAWGINAVLFAGLAALYELSLLVRLKPHPVALRRVGLFGHSVRGGGDLDSHSIRYLDAAGLAPSDMAACV